MSNVWADNFGVWHAAVPESDHRLIEVNAARKLIISALAEREGPKFDPTTVHVRRVRREEISPNTWQAVYQES